MNLSVLLCFLFFVGLTLARTATPEENQETSMVTESVGFSSSNHHHHHNHTSQTDHYHELSTDRIEESSSRSSDHHHESSTALPLVYCSEIRISYNGTYGNVRAGDRPEYTCLCRLPYGSVRKEYCPEWRGINNVVHSHTVTLHDSACVVTLRLEQVSWRTPTTMVCVDVNSPLKKTVRIGFTENAYNGKCQEDYDCQNKYACKNSKCDCGDENPIYISGSPGGCYSVKTARHSCSYTIQCEGSDRNSYCFMSKSGMTNGVCICKQDYELVDKKCVYTGGIRYVYTFTKRYSTVFYVLLSLSIVLILVGLVRLCMLRRRMLRQRNRVHSNSTLDIAPLTPSDEQKQKF